MDKVQFVAKVDGWARARHGSTFGKALLNDLVKDQLLPKAQRVANKGRRPTYAYDYRAYRTALHIVRFRGLGVVRHDQLRIMLFIGGYGQPNWVALRKALLNEYLAAVAAMVAPVRSIYVDNQEPIPRKHGASLLRQMGQLDDRLRAAGAIIAAPEIIGLVRASRQEAVSSDVSLTPSIIAGFENGVGQHPNLVKQIGPIFAGLLNVERGLVDASLEADSIEFIVQNATVDALQNGRYFYRQVLAGGLEAGSRHMSPDADAKNLSIAADAIRHTLRTNAAAAVMIFVFGLRLLHKK